jgi:hypothetical protein
MQKIKQTIIVNFNDTSYPSVAVERTLARRRAPREAIPLEARPVIINVRLPATLKNAVNVNNNNTVPPKKPNKPNVTKRNNNQNSTATYKPPNNKTKKTNKTNTKNNNANSTYTYKP